MQQQKLCLKWNNHTGNLVSVLETFQQKDVLVDVTLSCEGHNIKAHRMVLSACSPYFQNIFLENPCQHPIVIINGMKYEDITAILNFMYKGEVNVSHEGLSSFLQAAEALKVKGLAEVCGEKKSTNSNSQENEQVEQARPQRTDTPTKKRHRNRKRSFSDSNRSDDEGAPRKHKEINSPEVHELSGDESYTGDMSSNGQHSNSLPRVPQNVYSRSHQSSSNLGGEEIEDEYEVEPSKLLEQTLTTESVSMNNSASSDNSLRIERIMGNANDMESSSLQEPESPPDIKPIIEYGESSAGAPEGSMLVYNEHSQPGPSNIQDGSLLHDNSHTQDDVMDMLLLSAKILAQNRLNNRKNGDCLNYKCEHCSYSTEKIVNFEKHLSIHISSQTFDCIKCGEEFHNEIDLRQHLCTFGGLKIFGCEFCTKEFGFQTSLRKHLRRHTGYQSFTCNQCALKFGDKNELLRHLKAHNEGKKFDCQLCEKSFRERKDLIRHMQSHTGEKPYDCEECGKKFSRKNDLMRHSRLHTGERHFNCEYCGKEFYRKDKLKIHVRIHTGEKPFTCEYCGRCFAAKTDMIRHFRLHTPECECCGQKFTSKSLLNDHVCKKSVDC